MKSLCACLLLVLMPIVAMGGGSVRDGCVENAKYKSEYTIDRRCYVTDEQKQTSPYNAVVALLDNQNKIFCTGTIFRDNQNFTLDNAFDYETKLPVPGLFVYTAAHCIEGNKNIDGNKLRIRLLPGKEIITTKVSVGKSAYSGMSDEDYAIYKIPESEQFGLPYVDIAYDENPATELKVIGYGSLAIMANKEIKDYKQAYTDFLKSELERTYQNEDLLIEDECSFEKKYNKADYDDCVAYYRAGFDRGETSVGRKLKIFNEYINGTNEEFENGGIVVHNKYFSSFKKIHPLPKNDLLKESVCHINSETDICQSWTGNSGGGAFMNGKLLGMVSNAILIFGGNRHASILKDFAERKNPFTQDSKDNALFLNNSQQDNLYRMRPAASYEAGKK